MNPTGPIETLDVPETLHALIAARLDGLTPEERWLVQDGAVLGKTFTRQGLGTVTGMPEEELDPLLAALVRKEVLSIQADPRSPERGQYSFLQDIVGRVAYETLSKRDRKTKHLAAARFLSSTWGAEEDEIAEVVAAHYERAIELFEAGGATHPAARVSARLAEIVWDRGRLEQGLENMNRAFDILSQEEPDEDLAALAAQLGRFAFFAGETELAVQRIEAALDIAEALLLPEVLSQALNTKGAMLAARDYAPAATTRLIEKDLDLILESARQLGVPLPMAALARQMYAAASATGKGELDFFSLVLQAEEMAGLGGPAGH